MPTFEVIFNKLAVVEIEADSLEDAETRAQHLLESGCEDDWEWTEADVQEITPLEEENED